MSAVSSSTKTRPLPQHGDAPFSRRLQPQPKRRVLSHQASGKAKTLTGPCLPAVGSRPLPRPLAQPFPQLQTLG